ncbi:MAG: hypothetical protein J6A59_09645 [Lachnospiraceae bacterium]|nr:hypothetical protein [Lachnospiraceae bacterium]
MKKKLLCVTLLCVFLTGCTIEEEQMLEDVASAASGAESIEEIIDKTVEVEISSNKMEGTDVIVNEMKRLAETFKNSIKTLDGIVEPSNITEKVNIKDFNDNIMYSIITEGNDTLYITVPKLNKTYVLTGEAIESYLYSFVEYGTGIDLSDYGD